MSIDERLRNLEIKYSPEKLPDISNLYYIDVEDDETEEEAIKRYEAEHPTNKKYPFKNTYFFCYSNERIAREFRDGILRK